MPIRRRALLLTPVLAALPAAADVPTVRVGTLRYGSVAWELDVMRAHGLDAAAGVAVAPVEFAAAQATQVALQAGRVDTIVQDWIWVSRQRASGTDWTFAPSSAALGAVVAPSASPLRTIPDLAGRRLGIAGSPLDKSWLLLRAHAQQAFGLDLDKSAAKEFGPPPLLAEQLAAGRLDAVLTYWPFAAKAETQGMRRLLAVEDVVAALGFPANLPFLGYVFSDAWAARQPAAVSGFLRATREARAILGRSDAEWDRIAPLTGAGSAAELAALRTWYRRGIPDTWTADSQAALGRLYDVLASIGGTALVGPAARLTPGTFWHAA